MLTRELQAIKKWQTLSGKTLHDLNSKWPSNHSGHKQSLLLSKWVDGWRKDKDLRAQIPDLTPYISSSETVTHVVLFNSIIIPGKNPSVYRDLMRLTNAQKPNEIGSRGPCFASLSTEENDAYPELHLFETVFGRDSLRVAQDLLQYFPSLAFNTIIRLAELQGTDWNSKSEEEPGRIHHEYRVPGDVVAEEIIRKFNWEFPYYGSVDATIEYVRLICQYCKKYGFEILNEVYLGRDNKKHPVIHALLAAVDWIQMRMSANNFGFVEYRRSNPTGIFNQVWKDSGDSYFHADGTLANHESGIASIEVQVAVYDILLELSELFQKLSSTSNFGRKYRPYFKQADVYRKQAESLKSEIMNKFWLKDSRGGYFAIGTDYSSKGALQRLAIRTSNMGHVLNSRLLEEDDLESRYYREEVVKALFADDMLNASGIRTLSSKEARFRPGAYHNGNVWLWDTFYIAQGMRRHGYDQLASILDDRILSVVEKFHKFPEFARGSDDSEPQLNDRFVSVITKDKKELVIEQPPQEIQAWTVAAAYVLKQIRGKQDIFNVDKSLVDIRNRAFQNDIMQTLKGRPWYISYQESRGRLNKNNRNIS